MKGFFHKNGNVWQPTELGCNALKNGAWLEVRNVGGIESPRFQVMLSEFPGDLQQSAKTWKTLATAKRKALSLAASKGILADA